MPSDVIFLPSLCIPIDIYWRQTVDLFWSPTSRVENTWTKQDRFAIERDTVRKGEQSHADRD